MRFDLPLWHLNSHTFLTDGYIGSDRNKGKMKKMEHLVEKAKNGDEDALTQVIREIKDPVYQMSVRMLGYPCDAEDATQDILIKVITNLAGFKHKSSFKTWVYRICIHHLLNIKRTKAEKITINFQFWEECISADKSSKGIESAGDAETRVFINEVRTGCLQGLLLCLEKEIRVAFLLGEIFEISSVEGAQILDITPAAFRKRLQRGRQKLKAFLVKNCGLFNEKNPCQCKEQVKRDIHLGFLDPQNLNFTDPELHKQDKLNIPKMLEELDEIGKMIALFRTYPRYSTPGAFSEIIEDVLGSKRFSLLQ